MSLGRKSGIFGYCDCDFKPIGRLCIYLNVDGLLDTVNRGSVSSKHSHLPLPTLSNQRHAQPGQEAGTAHGANSEHISSFLGHLAASELLFSTKNTVLQARVTKGNTRKGARTASIHLGRIILAFRSEHKEFQS